MMADNESTPTGGPPAAPAVPPVTTPLPVEEGRTFTQADLDRIVKERLEREKGKYADYDDLKRASVEFKKLKDAQLTEAERATKRIQELEALQAEAETTARARELEVNERLIKADVRVLAGQMGFASPDDAYHLADLANVKIDDGEVKGVEKALQELAKAKPYLVGKGGGAGSPPNDPKRRGGTTEDEWVAEARRRYGIKQVPQP
jgi:hypothetical protein